MDNLKQNVFKTLLQLLYRKNLKTIMNYITLKYQKFLHACADKYEFSRDDLVMLELIESGSETGQSWLNRRALCDLKCSSEPRWSGKSTTFETADDDWANVIIRVHNHVEISRGRWWTLNGSRISRTIAGATTGSQHCMVALSRYLWSDEPNHRSQAACDQVVWRKCRQKSAIHSTIKC